MAPKMLAKSVSARLIKRRRVGFGFLVGFVFSLTYLSPSIYHYFELPNVNSSKNGAPNTSLARSDHMMSSLNLVDNIQVDQKLDEPINDQSQMNGDDQSRMNGDVSVSTKPITTSTIKVAQIKVVDTWDEPEKNIESEQENSISYAQESEALPSDDETTVSKNYVSTTRITNDSTLKEVTSNQERSDETQNDTNITCDTTYQRSDRCNMAGDIRIHGKSGSVTFMSSSVTQTWQIKPFARKADLNAMGNVREMFVRPSNGHDNPPRCAVNHSVPAVVFSVGGFTGNFFHDFSDVLVPLFQTSIQFVGEVQFLISDVRSWWVEKYEPVFKQLSRYELIDLDADDRVHCFSRVLVGLDSDDDLRIDTSRSTNGYSMVDFCRMLRSAFSLPRAAPITLSERSSKKPRLLILARGHTRKFTNIDEIVRTAEKTGYEVEVGEPNHNVSGFAHLVNSCDVMMGVHGAGLTNFVFLPTSAVVIQVVPWGNLEWIASTYYDKPPRAMGLKYLEYRISQDESTLTELYPRDDPVFMDPTSLHKRGGWETLKEIYLVKQNVKLDVERFRPVLLKALSLLHGKNLR